MEELQSEPVEVSLAVPFVTLGKIARSYPNVIAQLRPLSPIRTVTTFAGLLANPEVQANCFRLEVLVHLASVYCRGKSHPSPATISRTFQQLTEGICGAWEEPSEYIFVTLVNNSRGNFRIFEGLREGTSFYLQRVLNIVERMPARPPFIRLSEAIFGLLRLSDEVARRAGLQANQLGADIPLKKLPTTIAADLSSARDIVRFRVEDLARLGIAISLLDDFVFDLADAQLLLSEEIGNTALERRPIVVDGDTVYLAAPTAVASALTRFLIDFASSTGKMELLDQELAQEFVKVLQNGPVLGDGSGLNVSFTRTGPDWIAQTLIDVDQGRVLQLTFVMEGLDTFADRGLNGTHTLSEATREALESTLVDEADRSNDDTGFRGGVALVVACGFGRGFSFGLKRVLPEDWHVEFMPMHDFVTLSWLADFTPLSLWRLRHAEEAIEQLGLSLMNLSGLLNLIAWSRELHGHLVPHGQIPVDFISTPHNDVLLLPNNSNRKLRQKVLAAWNPRRALDVNGGWTPVRKVGRSQFEEDNCAPMYASELALADRRLRGVYISDWRSGWIEIEAPDESPKPAVFEYWKALCAWLGRAVEPFERAYTRLPVGPISFHIAFVELGTAVKGPAVRRSEEELRSLVAVCRIEQSRSLRIDISAGFEDGFSRPENIGERILVESLVAAVAELAGESADVVKRNLVANQICPDSEARWVHRFEIQSFRDQVQNRNDLTDHPILADSMDKASCVIGLAWKVRPKSDGTQVDGKLKCRDFLNEIVWVLLDELCNELRQFDRILCVGELITNYELTAINRDHWRRTSRALLATHNDKEAAMQTIVEHNGSLNSCSIASRILLEAALCECPLNSGVKPGRLDLSRLMAKAQSVFQFGGWSDAVHWGAMEPIVKITPLGDVHMNVAFMEKVYEPFGRLGGRAIVEKSIGDYSASYDATERLPTTESVFDPKFLAAWNAEFYCSLRGIVGLLAKLEEEALSAKRNAIHLRRSDLASELSWEANISSDQALLALSELTYSPRKEWRVVEQGFVNKDWFPWRFRRRLAILRRPFIQLDCDSDPMMLCAPGLILDAIGSMVSWFKRGEIAQPRSAEMRRWQGDVNNFERLAFNSMVANKLHEFGWETLTEKGIRQIIGRSLGREYGDVDVLAWKHDSSRVLAIECKDLQAHTTLGEAAEQLSDFRGEVRPNGKPDHLRRHLDRLDQLNSHQAEVKRFLRLTMPVRIEGHLVFKSLVPMKFAWKHMASRIKLSLFEELSQI